MSAIDLIVLGMIKEKEQSAYELQKNVEYRNISKWIKVSTPSIYKKVVQLEEKGYIKGNVSKEGNMPEKSPTPKFKNLRGISKCQSKR